VSGPQMRVVDGKMMLDEESLYVGGIDDDMVPRELVNEVYRSQDYRQFMGKRAAPSKWSNIELRQLYRLLGQYGLDFQFISTFFPNKTRAQVKARYKKEEKERPRMITLALKNNLDVDEEAFIEAVAIHRAANPSEESQLTGELDGIPIENETLPTDSDVAIGISASSTSVSVSETKKTTSRMEGLLNTLDEDDPFAELEKIAAGVDAQIKKERNQKTSSRIPDGE